MCDSKNKKAFRIETSMIHALFLIETSMIHALFRIETSMICLWL